MKLGMPFLLENRTVEEACALCAELGLDFVELNGSFPTCLAEKLHAEELMRLKEKYGIPWIGDLRDLWNLNPYINHNAIRRFFEKRLEMKTFSNVDVLITPPPPDSWR